MMPPGAGGAGSGGEGSGGGGEKETPLALRLKERIARDGPVPFSAFMQAALFDPEQGYYARGPDIGEGGSDFSTSVRFPPFRHAVFRYARACWESLGSPERFRFVELGAGTGQLAGTVTDLWREELPDVELEYVTVDASPGLRARQAAVPGVTRAVASTAELAPEDGLVFGNEVLDALPVRRVMGARDDPRGLLEVYVDVDARTGRFRERLHKTHDPRLVERFERIGVWPQPNQLCDVALGLDDLVRDAARLVRHGWLTLIDYGDPAPRLYHPQRLNGTLAAYRAHGKFFDPYQNVGEQDLTADVDFTTVTFAAEDAGLEALGLATQQEWLEALGVEDLGEPDDVRMVAGAASLGTAFFVLAFRRGVEGTVPGFS